MSKNKSSTAILPSVASSSSEDLVEAVAWLDCEGNPSAVLYRQVERLIQSAPAHKDVLFLILRRLERIEGSLTEFVGVLETILRTAPMQVVLGDPSGFVTLVLAYLDRDPQVRVFRPEPEQRDPQPALIVDSSKSSGELLGQVFSDFGRPSALAHTAADARKAITNLRFGLVLLDLDLPRMQSFDLAGLAKERQRGTTMVGMTAAEEPWAEENSARYGIRRIVPRPASILDLLEAAFRS